MIDPVPPIALSRSDFCLRPTISEYPRSPPKHLSTVGIGSIRRPGPNGVPSTLPLLSGPFLLRSRPVAVLPGAGFPFRLPALLRSRPHAVR